MSNTCTLLHSVSRLEASVLVHKSLQLTLDIAAAAYHAYSCIGLHQFAVALSLQLIKSKGRCDCVCAYACNGEMTRILAQSLACGLLDCSGH